MFREYRFIQNTARKGKSPKCLIVVTEGRALFWTVLLSSGTRCHALSCSSPQSNLHGSLSLALATGVGSTAVETALLISLEPCSLSFSPSSNSDAMGLREPLGKERRVTAKQNETMKQNQPPGFLDNVGFRSKEVKPEMSRLKCKSPSQAVQVPIQLCTYSLPRASVSSSVKWG